MVYSVHARCHLTASALGNVELLPLVFAPNYGKIALDMHTTVTVMGEGIKLISLLLLLLKYSPRI